LYGREALSLALWEKRRMRVFENRALRKIFGPKREDVTGSGDEIYDLYSSNIIRVNKPRRVKWEGHVARRGQERCINGFGGGNRGKETT